MSAFTNAERIACVQREIRQREHVYPRLIARGSMTPNKARHEIAVMQDILAVLVGLEAADKLI